VRFLIIHPGFLGDALFLGPGIRALKSRWPDSWIGVCLTPRGAAVGRLLPGCDEVLVYDKRSADRGLRGLLRVGQKLRAFRPDVALISHRSLRSGVLGWFSKARRRVGYAPLCTERLSFPADRPFPYRLLNCAAQVGANVQDTALALEAPQTEAYLETALADAKAPIVGMVPGAEQATKRWGSSGFSELAGRLSKRGASIVLLGGPAERDLAEDVRVKAQLPPGRNLAGNSIPESIAVLSRCDVVVGGDTGLVHCARALGIPVVMIFVPTPPARHLFSERERPVHLALECQPCHRSGQAQCPLGHHRCMVELPVAEVEQALRRLCPKLEISPEVV
jgi:heptosyltransferase II